MKIHKYKGNTEKEAMQQIKSELGSEALIVSVKQIRPKGIFRLFKKAYVEVTAAVDDVSVIDDRNLPQISLKADDVINNQREIGNDYSDKSDLDEFKKFITKFSSKQKEKQPDDQALVESVKETLYENSEKAVDEYIHTEDNGIKHEEEAIDDTPALKLLYEQLLDNEVDEPYANEIMNGLPEFISKHSPDVDELVSLVYKRIVKNLSESEIIDDSENSKPVFFVGPTGVGKTTTIAKIASVQSLINNKDVALITSDTYRIAAVEQLRTYANILGIPIKVVYTKEELIDAIDFFKDKDLVLIDTAGRSHKNLVHQMELSELLSSVEEKDVYLTLSVATKYKDMLKIIRAYKNMCEFKVIFTKLDETLSYGNILNIKMATGAKLSYVTFGQNVPDDISEVNPHEIAKNLLGGEAHGSS